MTATPPQPHDARRTSSPAKRALLAMAIIALAPVVASYSFYFFWPRDKQTNYGRLLAVPAPAVTGEREGGGAFDISLTRGRWLLIVPQRGACTHACERKLYATRQARTIQGRDQERVVRIMLSTSDVPLTEAQRAYHPGLEVVHVSPSMLALLPDGDAGIYLIDPLGNLVLAWPIDPDIKALAKDLGRLLRASQIG